MALVFAVVLFGCGRAPGDIPAKQKAVAGSSHETNIAAADPQIAPDSADQQSEPSKEAVSACLIQDGEAVPENVIHAVGTEPFWAADVRGRCVTYSTPDNQSGTRVWTRFEGRSDDGQWTGALDGRPFVMRTQAEAGCSDGMSDKSYPIAVTLTVNGEQRRGCAEPR